MGDAQQWPGTLWTPATASQFPGLGALGADLLLRLAGPTPADLRFHL